MLTEQHRSTRIICLGHLEPAEATRYFDGKGTEFSEPMQHFVGDLAVAINLIGVGVFFEEVAQAFEKGIALMSIRLVLLGEGQ